MSMPPNFGLNPIRGLCSNTWKLFKQSEARKQWECHVAERDNDNDDDSDWWRRWRWRRFIHLFISFHWGLGWGGVGGESPSGYRKVFSCDQAAIWLVQSVRPSVCPSVRPSHLFHHVPIIVSSWNFQELLPMTKVTSMQIVKVRGQRSRSQRSTLNCFRTVTPVWIHIWWWNDAYSLMMVRRSALLFLKVIRQISRSHDSKKHQIGPRLGVSGL